MSICFHIIIFNFFFMYIVYKKSSQRIPSDCKQGPYYYLYLIASIKCRSCAGVLTCTGLSAFRRPWSPVALKSASSLAAQTASTASSKSLMGVFKAIEQASPSTSATSNIDKTLKTASLAAWSPIPFLAKRWIPKAS